MKWRVKICQMVAGEVIFIEHVCDEFPRVEERGTTAEYLHLHTEDGRHLFFLCEAIRAVGLCPSGRV